MNPTRPRTKTFEPAIWSKLPVTRSDLAIGYCHPTISPSLPLDSRVLAHSTFGSGIKVQAPRRSRVTAFGPEVYCHFQPGLETKSRLTRSLSLAAPAQGPRPVFAIQRATLWMPLFSCIRPMAATETLHRLPAFQGPW